MCSF